MNSSDCATSEIEFLADLARTDDLDRELASRLLSEWARHYLASYFTAPPSKLHQWLVPELEAFGATRGNRLNVIAPRGSAKSTWISLAYPLREALTGRERYVMLLADTVSQGQLYLEQLKHEIEANPLIERDYPEAAGAGPVWRVDRIKLRNGVVIEAHGTGSKIRGRKNRSERPTLIILDDLQNKDTIVSALQRSRDWLWLTSEVMKLGSPETNFLSIGTALHREAIAVRLADTPRWKSHTFKSVVAWPDRLDMWEAWEQMLHERPKEDGERKAAEYLEANHAEMHTGAEVLWEEREPLTSLMMQRAEMGHTAFESEMQSNPVNPALCEWPETYFTSGIWYDEEQVPKRIICSVLSCDPSKGREAKHGDYCAYVHVRVDEQLGIWVDAWLDRWPMAQIVTVGLDLYRRLQPSAIAFESNQFQELIAVEFKRQCQAIALAPRVLCLNNHESKVVRIRRLEPYFVQRRIRFKAGSPGCALLVQQCQDFPIGDHDDGPDCAEGALRAAEHLLYGSPQGAAGAPYAVA